MRRFQLIRIKIEILPSILIHSDVDWSSILFVNWQRREKNEQNKFESWTYAREQRREKKLTRKNSRWEKSRRHFFVVRSFIRCRGFQFNYFFSSSFSSLFSPVCDTRIHVQRASTRFRTRQTKCRFVFEQFYFLEFSFAYFSCSFTCRTKIQFNQNGCLNLLVGQFVYYKNKFWFE